MNVQTSTTIDASAETLWAILATDYNNIGNWTTAVLHSEQDPDLPEGEGRVIPVPRLGEVHRAVIVGIRPDNYGKQVRHDRTVPVAFRQVLRRVRHPYTFGGIMNIEIRYCTT